MNRLQVNLLLLMVAMIWGCSFVVQKIGTGELGSISFTGIRFFVGALVVLPFALWQYPQVIKEREFKFTDWLGMILTGCVLLIAASLQQHGVLRTTVTNSGFLTALYVPLVPVLGLLIFRKKVHFSVWPASICCFIGTYILSGTREVELAVGDLWVISSTFFWAIHVIVIGILASRTRAPLIVAFVQFMVCAIVGLVLGFFVEALDFSKIAGAGWGICYMGIFSVGMAYTFQVVAQRFASAADAAIILSSETIFAAFAGMILLGEHLVLAQFFGAALIFISIFAVELLPLTKFGKPRALK